MKILRFITIAVVGVLWLGGCSSEVMHQLYQVGIIPDDYRFGDLYRLSSLPQFKDPVQPCPPAPTFPDTSRTDLYLLGDSFTEDPRVRKADLPVAAYHYFHWDKDQRRPVRLRSDRRNVLLIESVERHFREHLGQPVTNIVIDSTAQQTVDEQPASTNWQKAAIAFVKSEGIEGRLETVLFSQNLFLWLRELKASLTLDWFNRTADKVSLSSDGNALFTRLDVDPKKPQNSGFVPIPDAEITALVDSVNRVAERYRQAGFDEVILSIIPNKASILEPDQRTYNRLIERVQRHPNLTVPIIDTYSAYRQSNVPVYAKGDTHWNCEGRQIWLEAVRGAL